MRKKVLISIVIVIAFVFLNEILRAQDFENRLESQMNLFFKTTLVNNFGDLPDSALYKTFTKLLIQYKDELELKVSNHQLGEINKILFTKENYYNYYSKIVFVEDISGISEIDAKIPTVYIQTKINSAIPEDKVHRYRIYLSKQLLDLNKNLTIEKNLLKEFCEKTNSNESISYFQFLNFLDQDYSYMNYDENQEIFAVVFWRYLCEKNQVSFLNRGGIE